MILKQGAIYKYNTKGKWSDVWYIYSHDDNGPRFTIYKDSTAKKGADVSISVVAVANEIRFGRSSHRTIERPSSSTKDVRVHDSCFISIPLERALKKITKREMLWLCAVSVLELYDLVKLFSYSLAVMKIQPPPNHHNGANSAYSLHCYKPMAFIAETTWERFYDSPPQQCSFTQVDNSQFNRSNSMDALGEKKTFKALKGKFLKNEQKEASRSLIGLNEMPNHEYDEVPEDSMETCEKSVKETNDDECDKGTQSELRYETTILRTPLDEIALSHDSRIKHNGNAHKQTPTGKQNLLDEYGVIDVDQRSEKALSQASKGSLNDVYHSAEPTEPPSKTSSASNLMPLASQSIDVEMQLSLNRCRELNEKPIVAPKPKNPPCAPPSISTVSFSRPATPSRPCTTPTKSIMRSTPASTRTTVSENCDFSEKHVTDNNGVITVVSFTLKPSEDSGLNDPSDTSRSAPLKLKICDLEVESETKSQMVVSSPTQRIPKTPIDSTSCEQEFASLKLRRSLEYDELTGVETLDMKIEGCTTINIPPADVNSSTGCYNGDCGLRNSNDEDFIRNGTAQVRVVELNI
ncbi:hypothetical protein Tcan_10887 [Toxocara canis]|uniref:PH domain-containing protein n=1 Tax=Toxocara canis TaxID=6265 RepID=A0A0B2VTB2_TOXCA|nr:hypothetical protein Tcan_10887 [Toxocara canis]